MNQTNNDSQSTKNRHPKKILICGRDRAIDLAQMLNADVINQSHEIAILWNDPPNVPEDLKDVQTFEGDPTTTSALNHVFDDGPDTAVIMSDLENDNPDAKSVLIALALEALDRSIFTIVEIQDSNNIKHFDRTAVNETVCASDISEKLIAQAARNHFVSHVYRELLRYQQDGNEFYRIPNKNWKNFQEAFQALTKQQIIPIGIQSGTKPKLNPPSDTSLSEDDEIWVISRQQP